MTIIDYRVVEASSANNITDHVGELVKQGWQPLGPMMPVRNSEYRYSFCQTLVKYEQEPT